MPAFTIPVIPKELTESYWNKRELLARKVKTGVTQAIKELHEEFNDVPWKAIVALCGTFIPDKIGTFDECRSLGKKLADIRSKFDEVIKEVEGGRDYYSRLKFRAQNLKTCALKAAEQLGKKYPKAAKLAGDISKAATSYISSVNPSVFGKTLDDAYLVITRALDQKAGQLASVADWSSESAAAILKQLKIVRAENDPVKRATLFENTIYKGTGMGSIYTLSRSISARVKLGYLGNTKYSHLKTAEDILDIISKLADAPPAVTDKDVDAKISRIKQLAAAAAKL